MGLILVWWVVGAWSDDLVVPVVGILLLVNEAILTRNEELMLLLFVDGLERGVNLIDRVRTRSSDGVLEELELHILLLLLIELILGLDSHLFR